MPAYPYQCTKCCDAFEIRRGMTDDSPVVCMSCGSKKVRRLYAVVATVAGSGARGAAGESAPQADAPSGGCCGGACGCGH